MDKYIFDKSNGLWYELQGDYYIPCLILAEEETQPIGLWGQRHKQYLKEHRHIVYTTMLIDGTLNRYLADINQQAEQMFHRLITSNKSHCVSSPPFELPCISVSLFEQKRKYP